MRNRILRRAKALPLAFAVMVPSISLADDVLVHDCAGAPRAVRSVEANSLSQVLAAVEGAEIEGRTLKLTSGDKAIAASISNGQALFGSVPAGAWELCPSSSDVSVNQVSIISASAGNSTTTAAIIGAVGLLGGGAAIGFSDSGGGGSEPARVVIPPASQVDADVIDIGQPGTTLGREPTNNDGGLKPPCAATEGCLNDESPDPISPIS